MKQASVLECEGNVCHPHSRKKVLFLLLLFALNDTKVRLRHAIFCDCQQNSATFSDMNATTFYNWNRIKVKLKEDHTPECRRGAHLPFIGRWTCMWINHYCLWRMASTMTDLCLPSQPKLVLMCLPTEGWPGWVDLGDWLHTEIVYPPEDGHPSRH